MGVLGNSLSATGMPGLDVDESSNLLRNLPVTLQPNPL
jgi:hypothetical protein